MATVIEELVSRLGFQIDDKKLDQFNRKSEQLKNTLKRIAVISAAAATGIAAWVSKVGIATDANIKFADSIGISFLALQELQFATEREGGSLQSLQQSLLALSQRAGEAFRGMGEGVLVFGMLGISVTDVNGELKTSDKLLGELAKEFQRFGRIRQIEFAQKLGISPDMLLLLQKGESNLKSLRREAKNYGLVTEQTARNSEAFQDSFTNIRATVRALFTNIAGELMPIITDLADRFRDWFLVNRDIIKQNITKTVKVLVGLTSMLVKNIKTLFKILSAIVAVKILTFFGSFVLAIGTVVTAIMGLNANLTITNILMGAMPLLIGLAIAALIAFVLIWEDLKTGFAGGDSFLLRISEDSENAQKALGLLFNILDSIKTIFEAIIAAPFRLIKGILELIDITKLFGEALVNTVQRPLDAILERAKKLKDILKTNPTIPSGPGIAVPGQRFFAPQGNSGDTNINAEININSQNGDPIKIGQAVQSAITDLARNGINNQPIVVAV